MLSIDRLTRNRVQKDNLNKVGLDRGGRRVLPRLLRRPVRLMQRFVSGELAISLPIKLAMVYLVIGLVFGAFVTNTRIGSNLLAKVSAGVGFAVAGVRIDGATNVSHADIVDLLDFGDHKSMLAFDVHQARGALRELPWVSDAIISKAFPDYLDIRIVESTPYAIWQGDNQLSLIERNGKRIAEYNPQYAHLPLFVGKGANLAGAEIYSQVGRSDILAGEVKAYIRVADRRWDLLLKNGVRVRLPAEGVLAALSRFEKVEKATKILDRELQAIDLRQEKQLVVQLMDEKSAIDEGPDGQVVNSDISASKKREKQI